MHLTGRRAPSVRTLAACILLLTLIAVLVAAALIRTSTLLESATARVMSSAQSSAVASEAQLALLMHYRVANLYVVTREPGLEETQAELTAEMNRLLAIAEQHVSSAEEMRIFREAGDNVEAYLRSRSELLAEELDISDVLRASQPALEAAVSGLQALRAINDRQAAETEAQVTRWTRRASLFGAVAAIALVCGLLLLTYSLRRGLLRPILDLHQVIARFRSGEIEARAGTSGLREVQALSRGFNGMANALARQRDNQLAFLGGVVHDLRNPLQGLSIGIEALALEPSASKREAARATLERQIRSMARIMDDLLDAARIEAGRLELRLAPFDVRRALLDVVALYAPTSSEHRIVTELPPEPLIMHGDAERLQQVVANLVSNAIKFSPGGGRIDVSLSAGHDHIVLAVRDEGIGMSPEDQRDAFMPFRRRKAEIAPGAGLGLSVVRRIVAAHGGSIEIDSAPGCGSVFRIRLPRWCVEAEVSETDETAQVP